MCTSAYRPRFTHPAPLACTRASRGCTRSSRRMHTPTATATPIDRSRCLLWVGVPWSPAQAARLAQDQHCGCGACTQPAGRWRRGVRLAGSKRRRPVPPPAERLRGCRRARWLAGDGGGACTRCSGRVRRGRVRPALGCPAVAPCTGRGRRCRGRCLVCKRLRGLRLCKLCKGSRCACGARCRLRAGRCGAAPLHSEGMPL